MNIAIVLFTRLLKRRGLLKLSGCGHIMNKKIPEFKSYEKMTVAGDIL